MKNLNVIHIAHLECFSYDWIDDAGRHIAGSTSDRDVKNHQELRIYDGDSLDRFPREDECSLIESAIAEMKAK